MTCHRVHTGQFRLAWSSMMMNTQQQVGTGSKNAKQRRKTKRTAQVRELEQFPQWWIALMVKASTGTFVVLENVPYKVAHSWQVKLQKMQADIRKSYAQLPARLVSIASAVRWTVTDGAGVGPTSETWSDKERLARPVWKLTGSAQAEVADPVEQEMIGRLGKDWGKRVEEVTR